MSCEKTYLDSGVLITAFQGVESASIKAIEILNDEGREFASSRFVQLEVLPKAIFHKQSDEIEFYETFFAAVAHWARDIDVIIEKGEQIASAYGLATMDANSYGGGSTSRGHSTYNYRKTHQTYTQGHRNTDYLDISLFFRSVS